MASNEVNIINVASLKQQKINFDQENNKFKTSLNTFASSYLNTNSDPNVKKMAAKLNVMYQNINKGYNSINS